jgi:nicotinate-nucleotide adenylyltransferase
MRLGLLGGTFNPPHLGHLVCAQEAHHRLGLDRVLLLPARTPPHKEVADDPGPEVRLRLCELAVAGDERFGVSDLELSRTGPSYTVDTLRARHEHDPGDELTFIVGADMALSLASWREPAEVLRLARLAVAERDGAARERIAAAVAPFHDGTRLDVFAMPRLDISSTLVRERVAQGRPVRWLVPDAVAAEIDARGLYRSGGPAAGHHDPTQEDHPA